MPIPSNVDPDLAEKYRTLDLTLPTVGVETIKTDSLIWFPYQGADVPEDQEVVLETEEFTALCPWTGLPDQGTLTIRYMPLERLLEMKSLKAYLLSFRSVGIVQEDACARIYDDLKSLLEPRCDSLRVVLNYLPRGGIQTTCSLPPQ